MKNFNDQFATLSNEEMEAIKGGDAGDLAYAVGWVFGKLVRYSHPIMGGHNLAEDLGF